MQRVKNALVIDKVRNFVAGNQFKQAGAGGNISAFRLVCVFDYKLKCVPGRNG